MKAALESTHVLTRIDGQLCRLWKGTTEGGIPFLAFVARIAELATRDVFSTRLLH
ncbi:MAG: hypothetical protein ACJ768_19500 [Gaiellaceae bacterium]